MIVSGSEVAAAYKGRRPGRRFLLHPLNPLNPLGRGLGRFAPKVGGGVDAGGAELGAVVGTGTGGTERRVYVLGVR